MVANQTGTTPITAMDVPMFRTGDPNQLPVTSATWRVLLIGRPMEGSTARPELAITYEARGGRKDPMSSKSQLKVTGPATVQLDALPAAPGVYFKVIEVVLETTGAATGAPQWLDCDLQLIAKHGEDTSFRIDFSRTTTLKYS